jgi:hypothetical protein
MSKKEKQEKDGGLKKMESYERGKCSSFWWGRSKQREMNEKCMERIQKA